MTIEQHAEKLAGLPVKDYDPAPQRKRRASAKPFAHRLRLDYDSKMTFPELFDRFLSEPGVEKATALVIGAWGGEEFASEGSSEVVVEQLVAARKRLPELRALFLGDITGEECEISWIQQNDVGPLLAAYPTLEHFRVRGGEGLRFGRLRHDHLHSLIVETGGLRAEVVEEIAKAKLPQLEHLELWLGTEGYGGIADPTPLQPLLKSKGFPKLRYLGLRDSAIADAVAKAVVKAPLLKQVRVLDLSLGNLSDEGGKALLASKAVAGLEKLDIHHHFISPPVVRELKKLGIKVDASQPKEPEVYGDESHRYIAVSE